MNFKSIYLDNYSKILGYRRFCDHIAISAFSTFLFVPVVFFILFVVDTVFPNIGIFTYFMAFIDEGERSFPYEGAARYYFFLVCILFSSVIFFIMNVFSRILQSDKRLCSYVILTFFLFLLFSTVLMSKVLWNILFVFDFYFVMFFVLMFSVSVYFWGWVVLAHWKVTNFFRGENNLINIEFSEVKSSLSIVRFFFKYYKFVFYLSSKRKFFCLILFSLAYSFFGMFLIGWIQITGIPMSAIEVAAEYCLNNNVSGYAIVACLKEYPVFFIIKYTFFIIVAIEIFLIVISVYFYRFAKRVAIESASNVLRNDSRKPIAYFRPFLADGEKISVSRSNFPELFVSLWDTATGYEDIILKTGFDFGPVVAVDDPMRSELRFGVPREKLNNENWREGVAKIIEESQAFLVVAGESEGVKWEIDEIERKGKLENVLFLRKYSKSESVDADFDSFLIRILEKNGYSSIERGSNLFNERVISFFVYNGTIFLLKSYKFRSLDLSIAVRIFMSFRAGKLDPSTM